jgi:hypothetical protein
MNKGGETRSNAVHIFFPRVRQPASRPGPPHRQRFRDHTQSDTPHLVALLWISDDTSDLGARPSTI